MLKRNKGTRKSEEKNLEDYKVRDKLKWRIPVTSFHTFLAQPTQHSVF